METIYTIGHSTHPIDDFIAILKSYDNQQLVDIRTIPRSRHNPQFEQAALKKSLEDAGITYLYMKNLGGLRPKVKDTVNLGWRLDSFRNYADYMQTPAFSAAIEELIRTAQTKRSAIMCAEAVPWRCHRSLVSDALLIRGIEVINIFDKNNSSHHTLTKFAKVEGLNLTYPKEESA